MTKKEYVDDVAEKMLSTMNEAGITDEDVDNAFKYSTEEARIKLDQDQALFTKIVAEKIMSARKEAGFTRTKVARELGITENFYFVVFEKGTVNNIKLDQFYKICKLYNIDFSTFFEEVEKKMKKETS